jgi:hypothetical protein
MAAGLIKQSLPDILPDGMRPIKSDGIRLLNFDNTKTTDAFDAQQMARDLREAALLDRKRRPSSGAHFCKGDLRRAGRDGHRARLHRFDQS